MGMYLDAAKNLANGTSMRSYDCVASGHSGLASVLCRLGMRPLMSTLLAAELVATHMAVLSYVEWERETLRCIVSYASDPMVTLGAATMWHTESVIDMRESKLTRHILPQLTAVLSHDVLDTGDGGSDTVVARIMLLLAMDACGVLATGKEIMRWQGAGDFYRVTTFLRALEGTAVTVHGTTNREDEKTALAAVAKAMEQWASYCVSFTHFVPLSNEPREQCLWGLLGRRAAAILPRDQHEVDFLIPICRPNETSRKRKTTDADASGATMDRSLPPTVTMMLVRVQNHNKKERWSSDLQAVAITETLDPANVFSEGNPLAAIRPDHVLRVYMRPGGNGTSAHQYVEDTRSPGSYALGIAGVGPWSSRRLSTQATEETVDVVSPRVATELSCLLRPWWRVDEMVKADLETKGSDERRIDDRQSIQTRAIRLLGDHLVLNG